VLQHPVAPSPPTNTQCSHSKLAEAEPLGSRSDDGVSSFGDSKSLAKIRRGLFQVLRRHKRRVTSYDDSEPPAAQHATKRGIDLLSEIACREHHGDSGSGGSGGSGSGGSGGSSGGSSSGGSGGSGAFV
jgi:uncharacterized membrane protein YgcG